MALVLNLVDLGKYAALTSSTPIYFMSEGLDEREVERVAQET